MVTIASTATSKFEHAYSQETLAETLKSYCVTMGYDLDLEVVDRIFAGTTVRQRYFACELDDVFDPPSMPRMNAECVDKALEHAQRIVTSLLEKAGLTVDGVDLLATMMSTVITIPSLDGKLVQALKLNPAIKRMPINGLGCMAGAAGFARVADYLEGHPTHAAIVISCELGGSPFWRGGLQSFLASSVHRLKDEPELYQQLMAQIISAALFADGIAGALLVGDQHPLAGHGPKVLGNASLTVPDTEHMMSVHLMENGFRNNLSPEIPGLAARAFEQVSMQLCRAHGLTASAVDEWLLHPGGPAILDGIQERMALSEDDLALSRSTLANIGNCSAPTVLYMLDALTESQPEPGTIAVMAGMGPGFSEVANLIAW